MHADPVVSAGLRVILGSSNNLNLSLDDMSPLTEPNGAVVIADYRSGIDFSKEIAVEYGVHGFLLQSCVPDELTNAVISLSSGRCYLSNRVTHCLADSMSHSELLRNIRSPATSRDCILHIVP
jgi:DNA-binding NarL/FixJ family response regulator